MLSLSDRRACLPSTRTPEALASRATLFHEHLSIKLPPLPNAPPPPPPATYDVDLVVREVRIAEKEGVGCIVDGGQPEMGRDMATLKRGMRLLRDIMERPSFAPFRAEQTLPGGAILDDEQALEAYIKKTCTTVHHPLGTCRMGSDAESVVDPGLRVRGVDGLRVVDASTMPDLTGGNINAMVIMIAEKASDLILGNRAPA